MQERKAGDLFCCSPSSVSEGVGNLLAADGEARGASFSTGVAGVQDVMTVIVR